MKRPTFKKTLLAIAITLTSSIGSVSSVSAAIDKMSALSSVSSVEPKESLATKRKLLEEKHQKVEHEALAAYTGTQNALIVLQKNEPERALAILQDVSDKLDSLLVKYPRLNLIPASIEANVYNFDNDSKQVEKIIDAANDLLEDHKVQDARQILDQLVSEIRITTISIPLGTFPQAIKDAARLIDQGKTNEAEDTLYDVFNMLVKTIEIMPLPVLRAEVLLNEASTLEHKGNLSQEASRTEILILTDAAKDKLKLAEILGYGAKADYKDLYNAIDDIKDVINSEKSAAAWGKIKTTLANFKNKIIHPKQ